MVARFRSRDLGDKDRRSNLIRKSLAERSRRTWVGSCRRDLLDHVIAVNERHLKRLLAEYIDYYHDDRTHLGLGKGTPAGELGPSPPTPLFLTNDWADCIIVTIALLRTD